MSAIKLALATILVAAASAAASAGPTPVQYQVDQKTWQKGVTSTTSLTFELFSDAACTASVHSEAKTAGDPSIQVLKLSAIRVKGGDKPAKPAQLQTILNPTALNGYWLRVTGTGVTPIGGDCQAQAGSGSALAAGAVCPAGQALAGFDANGSAICEPVIQPYDPVGPQIDVPEGALHGWTRCFRDTYADSAATIATILAECDGADLLLACRPVGASRFTVLAAAPRADVTTDTGTGNAPHDANGTGWYFSDGYSWGFAAQGDALNRVSCDVESANPERRLCWHTDLGALDSGWRCGASVDLVGTDFERLIYHRD